MDEIIQEKVRMNAEKYPVEKAYGQKEKYTELGEEYAVTANNPKH